MKSHTWSKWVGASVLALSLATLPSALPAGAQTTADPAVPGDTTTTPGAYDTVNDDGFDWGWLGLLGLIGLAGLGGRKRDDTHYRDRDSVATHSTANPRY